MNLQVIDALWHKMLTVYGSEWEKKFSGPISEIKGAWADELKGFDLKQLKYALAHLPERPPNLIQFKELCAKAPKYFDAKQITYRPKPSEEKLAAFRKAWREI